MKIKLTATTTSATRTFSKVYFETAYDPTYVSPESTISFQSLLSGDSVEMRESVTNTLLKTFSG